MTSELTDCGRKLLLRATGKLTASDISSNQAALEQQKDALRNLQTCLLDFTEVSAMSLTADEIQQLAERDKQLARLLPPITIAVAAPTDVVFGLTRMWEVFAEGTRWQTRVFRSRTEAEAWLQSQNT